MKTSQTNPVLLFGVALICSWFAFGFVSSARADTIYTYIGQPFTNFSGDDSCTNGVGECSISGTITFASPLPSNSVFSLSGSVYEPPTLPPNLFSFSLTDGVQTLNNTSTSRYGGLVFGINLDTGSNGQILDWVFLLRQLLRTVLALLVQAGCWPALPDHWI